MLALPIGLGLASGSLVGFSLGLIGGGGSILAVPLMFYLVGVPQTVSRDQATISPMSKWMSWLPLAIAPYSVHTAQ